MSDSKADNSIDHCPELQSYRFRELRDSDWTSFDHALPASVLRQAMLSVAEALIRVDEPSRRIDTLEIVPGRDWIELRAIHDIAPGRLSDDLEQAIREHIRAERVKAKFSYQAADNDDEDSYGKILILPNSTLADWWRDQVDGPIRKGPGRPPSIEEALQTRKEWESGNYKTRKELAEDLGIEPSTVTKRIKQAEAHLNK